MSHVRERAPGRNLLVWASGSGRYAIHRGYRQLDERGLATSAAGRICGPQILFNGGDLSVVADDLREGFLRFQIRIVEL